MNPITARDIRDKALGKDLEWKELFIPLSEHEKAMKEQRAKSLEEFRITTNEMDKTWREWIVEHKDKKYDKLLSVINKIRADAENRIKEQHKLRSEYGYYDNEKAWYESNEIIKK